MALVCDVREASIIIIGTWLYFLAAHYTKTLHSQGHLWKIDYILGVQRAEETYYITAGRATSIIFKILFIQKLREIHSTVVKHFQKRLD